MSDEITQALIASGCEALQRLMLKTAVEKHERKFPLAEALARLGEPETIETFEYEPPCEVRKAGAFEHG